MTLFTISLILFLIMDPVGSASIFSSAVAPFAQRQRRWIAFREMLIALGVMLAFNFIGEVIFHQLELDEPTVRIASGIILFLVSIKILFPHLDIEFHRQVREGETPFIVPLAIPACASPALLATVMLFAHVEPQITTTVAAIGIAWSLALGILLFCTEFVEFVGPSVLEALEKLMGMVLILLAIQRLTEGVSLFVGGL